MRQPDAQTLATKDSQACVLDTRHQRACSNTTARYEITHEEHTSWQWTTSNQRCALPERSAGTNTQVKELRSSRGIAKTTSQMCTTENTCHSCCDSLSWIDACKCGNHTGGPSAARNAVQQPYVLDSRTRHVACAWPRASLCKTAGPRDLCGV